MMRTIASSSWGNNPEQRIEKRIFKRDVAAGLMRNIRIQCTKDLDGEIIGVLGISDVYNASPTIRNLERIGSSQRTFMSISAELAFKEGGETVAVSFGHTLIQVKDGICQTNCFINFMKQATTAVDGLP
jgi:hypothetical protein